MDVTELKDAFEPEKLPDGTYLATAGSGAFPILLAFPLVGAGTSLGERFLEDGRRQILVRVGNGRRKNAPRTHVMGMDANFFSRQLDAYRGWKTAWWREAIQNAVDAGAKNVAMETSYDPETKSWQIVVDDDGRGMSEETLLRRFLHWGGTTKTDESDEEGAPTVGGFGKAKQLLLLPWMRWQVETLRNIVQGQGNTGVVDDIPQRKGTKLTVTMPDGTHTEAWHAQNYLAKCSIPGVRFTVNGVEVEAALHRGRQVHEFPGKAIVYHNKSANAHSTLVRVKGVLMYERWQDSSVPGTVIIELTGRSVDLLEENRNGLRDETLDRDIQKYIGSLTKDATRMLRSKAYVHRYRSEGLFQGFTSKEAAGALLAGAGPVKPKKGGGLAVTTNQLQHLVDILTRFGGDGDVEVTGDKIAMGIAPGASVQPMMDMVYTEEQWQCATQQLVWKPDFLIDNRMSTAQPPKKFLPTGMTPTILKLAKVWTEIVRGVLIALRSSSEWGVGWVFDSDVRAEHAYLANEHWILLNPYMDATSGETINPNTDEGIRHLFGLAVHEATHMVDGVGVHDGAYASALTANISKTVGAYKHIRKAVAAIKTRTRSGTAGTAGAAPRASKEEKYVDPVGEAVKHVVAATHKYNWWIEDEVAKRVLRAHYEDREPYAEDPVLIAVSQTPEGQQFGFPKEPVPDLTDRQRDRVRLLRPAFKAFWSFVSMPGSGDQFWHTYAHELFNQFWSDGKDEKLLLAAEGFNDSRLERYLYVCNDFVIRTVLRGIVFGEDWWWYLWKRQPFPTVKEPPTAEAWNEFMAYLNGDDTADWRYLVREVQQADEQEKRGHRDRLFGLINADTDDDIRATLRAQLRRSDRDEMEELIVREFGHEDARDAPMVRAYDGFMAGRDGPWSAMAPENDWRRLVRYAMSRMEWVPF